MHITMKKKIDKTVRKILLTIPAFVFCFSGLLAQNIQKVYPEQVGLDSHRLMLADSAINAEIKAKTIPGAVLAVTRHGKIAYLKAYGNRSVYPKKEKMTTETIFDMASCTKPVATATSALILMEQGKFRLLDPVNHYIPNFKSWKDGTKDQETIRIIDLFTHTSGLPSYASVNELKKKFGAPNPKALMCYIDTCERLNAPEEKMRYSCLNYITLQNIIQNITGQTLKNFAQQHIFTPLGMKHSGYQPSDSLLPIIAPTEKQPDGSVLRGQVHDPLARVMNGGISGNAGLFTSAEDLSVFVSMLLNGGEWNGVRILSPATVKAMITIPEGFERFGRSLGWDLHSPYASCNGDLFSRNTFGHTGYTGTAIVVDPDADMGVILLTNCVHPTDTHSVVRLRSVIANIVASSIINNQRKYFTYYYQRCEAFDKEPAIGKKDIVMLGNSLTEKGGDWAKRLANKYVINRGIVGDEALGIFDRLEPIVKGHPKRIYLMIGINDLSHTSLLDSIAGNIQKVVHKIRTQSPQTNLYVQSILPINESFGRYSNLNGKTNLIPELNKKIESLAKAENARYLNFFPLFKEAESNTLCRKFTTDGIHLTAAGYLIWEKALKETLKMQE